jgi:hypothetical protein
MALATWCHYLPKPNLGFHKRDKSVREALTNRSWVRDIQGALVAHVLCDYVVVWDKVRGVVLNDLASDRFVWQWTTDGTYIASSAYRAFFHWNGFATGSFGALEG